jgi:hypothetical protein
MSPEENPQVGKDLVQVGASSASRDTLNRLKEAGHLGDLQDGYRLAIAVAIGFGREPRASSEAERKTMFAVGNLDPDSALREAIKEIYPPFRATPARAAEDLAEQGLQIIKDRMQGDEILFSELLEKVKGANASSSGVDVKG